MRKHAGQVISRYNVCSISCKANAMSVTVATVISQLKKSGIHVYPSNTEQITDDTLAPSLVTNPADHITDQTAKKPM